MGKIQVLPPEEARKIAAGEVVERPASLVREFLDNAIDSGAKNIELRIEAGGIKLTEVSDDGCGMSRADLELSIKTHATSKIRSMAELATARTLGFRGEALAAAAAVAELEILSCEGEEGASGEAWLLQAGPDAPDSEPHIEAARRTRGSSVRTRNLFDSIPARKRFLKREGSEALMCKQIFIDKALAFPEINFRFVQDGKLKLFFPAVKTHKERFASAVLAEKSGGASGFSAFLHEIAAHGRGYDLIIVVGGPEIYRDQRREQFIFANGRRINDFSLQQALEYGTQGAFPNGTHPVGAVFLEIDGALADFNIHPAKREARFICAADIHHTLTGTLRFYFHSLLEKYFKHEVHGEEKGFGVWGLGYRDLESKYSDISGIYPSDKNNISNTPPHTPYPIPHSPYSRQYSSNMEALVEGRYNFAELPSHTKESYTEEDAAPYGTTRYAENARYVGRAFDLFILVEKDGRLYAVDQHAAHERILYDRALASPIPKQELLVPIPFTTDCAEDDEFLRREKASLAKLGVVIAADAVANATASGGWKIEALPVQWRLGDEETVREILALRTSGENIALRWAATIACHAAIRDGDIIDDDSALDIASQALELPIKCCPHGRPILFELKKDDFLRSVRRIK